MNSFGKKVENFFYYYKWHTVFSILAVVMILTTIHQVISRTDYDLRIVFAGKASASDDNIAAFNQNVKSYCTDVDGDGQVNVFSDFSTIYGESNTAELDTVMLTRLQAMVMENEAKIFIMDEKRIKIFGDNGAFMDLNSLDLGVPIGNNEFAYAVKIDKQSPLFAHLALEGDFYIAIRSKMSKPDKKSDALYENAYALFKQVISMK